MTEEKRNDEPVFDVALAAAADEELRQACTLEWRALSKITPWGDSYEGTAGNGEDVTFERAYVWAGVEGGDILAEVTVFRDRAYEAGARASRLIKRPTET